MISIGKVGKDKVGALNYYCGRPKSGEKSPLGNPYVIGKHGTRDEVIAMYKSYLLENITKKTPVRIEMIKLFKTAKSGKDIHLQCFCWPENDCHARHIKEFLEEKLNERRD